MRIANHALKLAIVEHDGLSGIDEVYTLRDAARRFGVARNTVARWSDDGVFVARVFVLDGKHYRYYTDLDCELFEQTMFYKDLVNGKYKSYSKVSVTIHDFMVCDDNIVFTVAECADRLVFRFRH